MFTLTKSEQEILNLMWEQNRPLTRSEIINLSVERSWKTASIHILLNKLLEKEAIVVDGFVKVVKNYGRTYSPAITREAYEKMIFRQYFRTQTLSVDELFASLLDEDDPENPIVNDSVINGLEDFIKKWREGGE